MKWFGKAWNPHLCVPEDRISTPVGEKCPKCTARIDDGDQGIVMPKVDAVDFEKEVCEVVLEAWHLDCFLRNTLPKDMHERAGDALTAAVDVDIAGISNPVVADQARSVLVRIREAIGSFDLSSVPALRSSQHDDGSFTIEWRFPDRRLAFTLEADPSESGWHLVSSRSSDDVRAYGGLPAGDLRPLLGWALRQMPSS